MLHGRVLRPPAVGAKVAGDRRVVDRARCPACASCASTISSASSPPTSGRRCARRASSRCAGATSAALIGHEARASTGRARGPFVAEEVDRRQGRRRSGSPRSPTPADAIRATYSLADPVARLDRPVVRGRRRARRRRHGLDRVAGEPSLPRHLRGAARACRASKVRVIYLDGAGCYGMNGHDDAAADAALLSKAVGQPVRVQWSREDELGWDPKGPPQLLELRADADRRRPHRRLGNRDVGAARDRQPRVGAAARAAGRRHARSRSGSRSGWCRRTATRPTPPTRSR